MPNVTIVLYHDLASPPTPFEEALGINTRPDLFLEQLDYLEKNYNIIDLDTLLNGPLPKRPLLITFDDFYYSVLEAARNYLAPRNIPAILFANPDLLGKENYSLDNALSWYAHHFGISELVRTLNLRNYDYVGKILSEEMSQKTAAERNKIRQIIAKAGGIDSDIENRSPVLKPEDLFELSELGVEIGNHTATHTHCRSLTADELKVEIVRSKEKLQNICKKPIRAFSVPYGNEGDLTVEVLSELRKSHHKAIFLVHARSNWFRPACDIWYRVSLHNEKPSELSRQLRVFPLLRTLKKVLKF